MENVTEARRHLNAMRAAFAEEPTPPVTRFELGIHFDAARLKVGFEPQTSESRGRLAIVHARLAAEAQNPSFAFLYKTAALDVNDADEPEPGRLVRAAGINNEAAYSEELFRILEMKRMFGDRFVLLPHPGIFSSPTEMRKLIAAQGLDYDPKTASLVGYGEYVDGVQLVENATEDTGKNLGLNRRRVTVDRRLSLSVNHVTPEFWSRLAGAELNFRYRPEDQLLGRINTQIQGL